MKTKVNHGGTKEARYVNKEYGYFGVLCDNEYHEGKVVLVKNDMVILLEDTSVWWDEGKFLVSPLMPGESFVVTII